jgi:Fe-S-cluster containining protein
MNCDRCGDCCKSMDFMEELGYDSDADAARWQEFYAARGIHTERNGTRTLLVRVPQRCQHLEYSYTHGNYSCAIYSNRPDICRDWQCDKGKEPK